MLDSRFRGNDGGGGVLFFPINSCCVASLDSRLRGNDGGGGSVFSDKVLLHCVAGFLRSRE
ncbi:hypothetical protein FGF62_10075 [Neisseria meningitidis]|nr:hypothetical protein [Neisseria meningitidis]